MNRIKIVITNDYEVFGNGSGDIFESLILPTNNLLDIADKYQIPVTLMAEMAEILVFKERQNSFRVKGVASNYQIIKQNLIEAMLRGHDIQLHFHPQFVDNFGVDSETIFINELKLNISTLSKEEIKEYLIKAIAELQDILVPIDINYKCRVFRAGYLAMQPESNLLQVLSDIGILIDTTVAPGCYLESRLVNFNYTHVPNLPFWRIKNSVNEISQDGLLEVPITTVKYGLFKKAISYMLRKIYKIQNLKVESGKILDIGINKELLINKVLSSYRSLDFCSMSAIELEKAILAKEKNNKTNEVIPIVITGHSKFFNNGIQLERFINRALQNDWEFCTFKNLLLLD